MEKIPFSNIQPKPVPYGMFVDKWGQLNSHEVAESPSSWKPGKNKGVRIYGDDPSVAKRKPANLKKDLIFKLLLGNPQYKDEIAIPFHQAFWGHHVDIQDLTMITTPLTPSTFDARSINPDVIWQDPKTGSVFLTEMQRQPQKFYSQRISLYDGKARTVLAVPGNKWDFDQVSVFVLGIADFNLHKQGPSDYLHEYATINLADPGDLLTGKDFKILMDLKKAKKISPDILSQRYKWTYLLNNFHELDKMPDFMKDGFFENVIEIANKLNRNKMEELMDFITELHNGDREERAREKGVKIGVKIGVEKGAKEATLKTIKTFIENCPKDFNKSAPEIAALFDVDENIVKPLLPA